MDHSDEQPIPHVMTYAERETLKRFARQGDNLDQALIAVAHWLSCGMDISFSGYVANWAAANQHDDVAAIRAQWPLTGPRMIANNATAWGSFLGRT